MFLLIEKAELAAPSQLHSSIPLWEDIPGLRPLQHIAWARIRRYRRTSPITRRHEKASFLDVCVIDQPKVEVKRNDDGRAWMKECSQPLPMLHEREAGAPFVASSDFSASVGSVRNCPRFI